MKKLYLPLLLLGIAMLLSAGAQAQCKACSADGHGHWTCPATISGFFYCNPKPGYCTNFNDCPCRCGSVGCNCGEGPTAGLSDKLTGTLKNCSAKDSTPQVSKATADALLAANPWISDKSLPKAIAKYHPVLARIVEAEQTDLPKDWGVEMRSGKLIADDGTFWRFNMSIAPFAVVYRATNMSTHEEYALVLKQHRWTIYKEVDDGSAAIMVASGTIK